MLGLKQVKVFICSMASSSPSGQNVVPAGLVRKRDSPTKLRRLQKASRRALSAQAAPEKTEFDVVLKEVPKDPSLFCRVDCLSRHLVTWVGLHRRYSLLLFAKKSLPGEKDCYHQGPESNHRPRLEGWTFAAEPLASAQRRAPD